MLSFSQRVPKRDTNDEDDFAEMGRETENFMTLKNIIEIIRKDNVESNILYLKKNSKPNWNVLNEKFELDKGRIVSFDGIKIAKKGVHNEGLCII